MFQTTNQIIDHPKDLDMGLHQIWASGWSLRRTAIFISQLQITFRGYSNPQKNDVWKRFNSVWSTCMLNCDLGFYLCTHKECLDTIWKINKETIQNTIWNRCIIDHLSIIVLKYIEYGMVISIFHFTEGFLTSPCSIYFRMIILYTVYIYIHMWRFPSMGVPPNHPCIDGFSIINHPVLGTPMTMETSICWNHHWSTGRLGDMASGFGWTWPAGPILVWSSKMGLGSNCEKRWIFFIQKWGFFIRPHIADCWWFLIV